MSKHLQRDLESLERQLLAQSSLVEEMIRKASRAIREIRPELVAEIMDRERLVDEQEVRIEEDCLKILALHQPVAVDLRRTATILKINNDLERIADLAVNVAERAHSLSQHSGVVIPETFDRMAQVAVSMVQNALDALVKLDVNIARQTCLRDDEVDDLHRKVIGEIHQVMLSQPELIEAALYLFSASRDVERIADHATNIAEDVIYLVDGEIARHKYELDWNMSKHHVLIIEDDRSLSDVLSYNLEQAGYTVSVAHDGQDGLNRARHKIPDVIVLDLMLPVIDGLEVCRRLRADAAMRDVLVVMLTAKAEETDQVVGLAIGADDYVTKPFSVQVLLERIKALLRRRSMGTDDGNVVASQGIVIDRQRHHATAGDRPLDLTLSEFALLDTLIRQPGRAFTRSELIDAALGDAVVLERTIDVHVRAIRKKLGSSASLIETVRGVGYRFRDHG